MRGAIFSFNHAAMRFGIVEKLGGWDDVIAVLERRGGKRLTYGPLKWRQSGFPAHAKFALIVECQDRGIEWSEQDFARQPDREAA